MILASLALYVTWCLPWGIHLGETGLAWVAANTSGLAPSLASLQIALPVSCALESARPFRPFRLWFSRSGRRLTSRSPGVRAALGLFLHAHLEPL